jgi:hypothetical protein
VVVGTIGEAVPVEVLAAARLEVVPVEGEPGAPTPLADRFVEPMVGGQARSRLQRLLDGTYVLDLVVCSRERDALLRIAYAAREARRLEPSLCVPPVRLFDLQPTPTKAARAWNEARVAELCGLLGVDEAALREGIRRCNEERRGAVRGGNGSARRVFVTGSPFRDTVLEERVRAAGAVVVSGPPLLAAEVGDPYAAVARRYEHPLLAGPRASSAERARLIAEAARGAGADVVLALYLEGDDGLRWELPELRAALDRAGLPLRVIDRQPYDLRGLELDV